MSTDYLDLKAGVRIWHPILGSGVVMTDYTDRGRVEVELDQQVRGTRIVWLLVKNLSTKSREEA